MLRKLTWLLVLLFLLALGASIGGFVHLKNYAQEPLALPATPFAFTVQSGQNLRQVAKQFAAAGLLKEPLRFVLMARLLNRPSNIKAGDYELAEPLSPSALLDKMVRGEVRQVSITFIEGHTLRQLRKALDEHPDLLHKTAGLSEAELLAKIGATEQLAEGLFFPDTYRFAKGASDLDILKRAYQSMQQHLNKEWQTRDASVPLRTPYEALVLASIIEKETGRAHERAQIAAVFVNRLRINMRMQTDPSVIYGLGEGFDGNLTKAHLQTDTPYNTYTRAGLPPTPIAMPGLGAIQAALRPAKGPWLYFVSRGDGTHQFSASLEEHNKAVAQYQK